MGLHKLHYITHTCVVCHEKLEKGKILHKLVTHDHNKPLVLRTPATIFSNLKYDVSFLLLFNSYFLASSDHQSLYLALFFSPLTNSFVFFFFFKYMDFNTENQKRQFLNSLRPLKIKYLY